MKRTIISAFGLLAFCGLIFGLYYLSDNHYVVSRRMGWQCTGMYRTKNPRFPVVQDVKLWFLDNPHYEERASGPHLCEDLHSAGKPYADVTFDVWGNKLRGLHGYDGVSIEVDGKQFVTFGFESGGFHWDEPRPQTQFPSPFPLDVFR